MRRALDGDLARGRQDVVGEVEAVHRDESHPDATRAQDVDEPGGIRRLAGPGRAGDAEERAAAALRELEGTLQRIRVVENRGPRHRDMVVHGGMVRRSRPRAPA
ncbi:hypothetical protein N865_06260 [Intrasporangium oryzae NRRL B-24470]|uniref:Uncharacterized protein n=1 Tax=Intrasporangium oryzae NRRL B-24470 TaxID=1386089 RepID=W9GAZ4_9MICO|nr:hypothetical protein N865_06260 [Intrasporangium oryzae NRRL B-24470]